MFEQCPDCRALVTPAYGFHYCVKEYVNGKAVRGVTKRFNHVTNTWDVAPEAVTQTNSAGSPVPRGIAHYDIKKGEWVETRDEPKKEEEKTYEVASCEIPPKKVTTSQSTSTSYNWSEAKPWEGIDRWKWPNTWNKLIMLYYSKEWWGKYISNDEYRDRILRGIYKPEPKYGSRVHYQDEEDTGTGYPWSHWPDGGEG